MGDVNNNDKVEENITKKLNIDDLDSVLGGHHTKTKQKCKTYCPKCEKSAYLENTGNKRTRYFLFIPIPEKEIHCTFCGNTFWD